MLREQKVEYRIQVQFNSKEDPPLSIIAFLMENLAAAHDAGVVIYTDGSLDFFYPEDFFYWRWREWPFFHRVGWRIEDHDTVRVVSISKKSPIILDIATKAVEGVYAFIHACILLMERKDKEERKKLELEKAKHDVEKAKYEAEKAKYEAEKVRHELEMSKLRKEGISIAKREEELLAKRLRRREGLLRFIQDQSEFVSNVLDRYSMEIIILDIKKTGFDKTESSGNG